MSWRCKGVSRASREPARARPAPTRERGAAHAPDRLVVGEVRDAKPSICPRAEHGRARRRNHPRQLRRRRAPPTRGAAVAGRPQHRRGLRGARDRDRRRPRRALPTQRRRTSPRRRDRRDDRPRRRPGVETRSIYRAGRGAERARVASPTSSGAPCSRPACCSPPRRGCGLRVRRPPGPTRRRPPRRLLQEAGFAHALGATRGDRRRSRGGLRLGGVAGDGPPRRCARRRCSRRGSVRGSRRRHGGCAAAALWSDVCDLLVSAVRAGMSLPDAVAALAVSGPPALRGAFSRFAADMAASGHFDSSALRLKATLADPVADRIIETLRMARHVGGTELTSVLRALSSSVRADATLRAEVEARQSWVRGAAVVGVVAPWIVLGLLAIRPEGAATYSHSRGRRRRARRGGRVCARVSAHDPAGAPARTAAVVRMSPVTVAAARSSPRRRLRRGGAPHRAAHSAVGRAEPQPPHRRRTCATWPTRWGSRPCIPSPHGKGGARRATEWPEGGAAAPTATRWRAAAAAAGLAPGDVVGFRAAQLGWAVAGLALGGVLAVVLTLSGRGGLVAAAAAAAPWAVAAIVICEQRLATRARRPSRESTTNCRPCWSSSRCASPPVRASPTPWRRRRRSIR